MAKRSRDRLTENVNKLIEESERQRQEAKELGLRFGYYQQSTQAVVNLAFSLVASATISVFITTTVLKTMTATLASAKNDSLAA